MITREPDDDPIARGDPDQLAQDLARARPGAPRRLILEATVDNLLGRLRVPREFSELPARPSRRGHRGAASRAS